VSAGTLPPHSAPSADAGRHSSPPKPEAGAGSRRASRELAAGSATRRKQRRLTPAGAMTVWIAISVGLLALWMLLFSTVLSGVQQSRSQRLLYDNLRESLAAATAPLGGVVKPGTAVAILDAPSGGLSSVVVVEGTTGQVMQDGPGHRRDTVMPGQAGVSVVYGRSVTFGGPFAAAPQLRVGDTIRATTGQGEFTYIVDRVRRPGDDVPPPLAAGGARLVLVTSEGDGWRGKWSPDRVVYVDATLRGEAQPNPGGRLNSVTAAENAMGRDSVSLLPLMLWTQVFLLASAVLVWTWYRWGRWQSWLVGLPVLLAVLWGLGENALALLPNLI